MRELFSKPMRVTEILDSIFRIYKGHFTKIFVTMLIIFGPLTLLSSFITYGFSQHSIIPDLSTFTSGESFLEGLSGLENGMLEGITPARLAMLFILMPILFLIAFPVGVAMMVHMVGAIRKGEDFTFGEVFQKSIRRLGALIGSSILYGLMVIGVYLAIILVFVLLSFIVGAGLIGMFEGSAMAGILGVILLVILGIVFLFILPLLLLMRWSFYIPIVAVENQGIGIGRSWHLTKGNVWRLLGIFLVIYIITSIFQGVASLIFTLLLQMTIVGQIVQVLIDLLILPISLIAYAVLYYDLRVRNEGSDLDEALARSYSAHGETPDYSKDGE